MSDPIVTEGATPEEPTIDPEQSDADAPVEGEDALGDPGKKALDAMKQKLRDAERSVRESKAELAKRDAAAALKDLPAEEAALSEAEKRGEARATEAANKRILKSELKALATGKLADAADAALYINLDDFAVDDNGDADSEALNDAIAALLERKPHLAAQKQSRFDGAADQGAKGKDSRPSQLTQTELDRMSPAEVVTAQRSGRLNSLLGITN